MNTEITQTTTTTLNSSVQNFNVNLENTDGASGNETYWYNQKWSEYLGYYDRIPELKSAIKGYATWITGKGVTYFNPYQKAQLEQIRGWGEDDFLSILWNMLVVKKINGDAYAEIIRDEKGNLINLKPLDPSRIRHVVNSKGVLIRYDYQQTNKDWTKFKPYEIFHIVNDRIADNIHGDSVLTSIKWAIDARNEAMQDWRRISHRSTIKCNFNRYLSP